MHMNNGIAVKTQNIGLETTTQYSISLILVYDYGHPLGILNST